MAVQNKPKFKKKGNSWKKKKGNAKDEISKPNPAVPKAGPVAGDECFHCKENGHWKRNCKLYMESMKDRGSKGSPVACTLVVYVMDIFLANSYINS
jgi:hypothetical protein